MYLPVILKSNSFVLLIENASDFEFFKNTDCYFKYLVLLVTPKYWIIAINSSIYGGLISFTENVQTPNLTL